MRLSIRTRLARRIETDNPSSPASKRDRLARMAALATVICLCAAFFLATDMRFLTPGPLTSAHGAIEQCGTCHTGNGSGRLGWIYGLFARDRIADSKACLTCHQMPGSALNAHGVSHGILEQSTKRLTKVAAQTPAPRWAHAQSLARSAQSLALGALSCATCHQEHRGAKADLRRISDQQCASCHVVKFDSFEGHHPAFTDYPFRRRTRIIFDHAGHFDKHFPEVAQKDSAISVPSTCTACHDSRKDKRVMAVAPFEKTCAACHLGQITGKDRISGPKGLAFLTVPGLDLRTLKMRKAPIGEWPESSEAELTGFMKVIIARSETGRAAIKAVDGLDLQNLSKASAAQIKAVTSLVWEIKRLYHSLIRGSASDVMAQLDLAGADKLGAFRTADLIATIPLDVIVSAQRQWLPNLAAEIAARPPEPKDQKQSGWVTTVAGSRTAVEITAQGKADSEASEPASAERAAEGGVGATPAATSRDSNKASPPPRKQTASADAPPSTKAADQTDDLLNPTEEELRAIKNRSRPAASAAPSDKAQVSDSTTPRDPASGSSAPPLQQDQPRSGNASAPAPTLAENVDAENWAAHGGWYRQDYAISYRPSGHKDRFISAWLRLTGPHATKGVRTPAAATFAALSGKDAQGSCTKCHSVDDSGSGRAVNFAPLSAQNKLSRFTAFIHEPHFAVVKEGGCLACHDLLKARAYLENYGQGDPNRHVSNFSQVGKERCQTCHTSGNARQDCLTCHKYHVEGPTAPLLKTTVRP